MRSFVIASFLGAASAAPATVFQSGDAPACSVDSSGATVVHYTDGLHPSFKCTHSSATTCSCTSNHPTHHKGLCQQFTHFASGKTLNSGGDCSDSGAWAGTCANGNLIVDPLGRTADDQCGSCDNGYYLSGTSCVAWAGSCGNGDLIAQASRTIDNHCGSCDNGYYLYQKSCIAHAGSCTNGALIAQASRDQANHCGSCNNGYYLNGKSCSAHGGSCTNGALIAQASRDQANHCGSCNSNYYLNGKSCTYCSNVSCGSNYNRAGSCSGTNNGFSCSAKACDSNYCNGRGTVSGNKVSGCSCSCTGGWYGSRCTDKNGYYGGWQVKAGAQCKKGNTVCGCDSRAKYHKKDGNPRSSPSWTQWPYNTLSTGGNNGWGWGTACNEGGTIHMVRNCINKYGNGGCSGDSERMLPCARAQYLSDIQGSYWKTSPCYRCRSCWDNED